MLAGVSQSTENTQATWCRLIIHQGLKITKKKGRVQLVSLYTRLPLLQRQICVVIKIAKKTLSTFIVVLQNCAEGYLHVQIMDNVVSRPPKIWTLSLGVTVYCTHRYWASEKFFTHLICSCLIPVRYYLTKCFCDQKLCKRKMTYLNSTLPHEVKHPNPAP